MSTPIIPPVTTVRIPSSQPPRSSTIEEELEVLRQEWKQFPEKRGNIEKRAALLKRALESFPQWKQVKTSPEEDQRAKEVMDALNPSEPEVINGYTFQKS